MSMSIRVRRVKFFNRAVTVIAIGGSRDLGMTLNRNVGILIELVWKLAVGKLKEIELR